MDRDSAYTTISKLIVELFEIDADRISPEADLFRDLDIDSIDAVDLAVEFRKQTGVKFSPDEFKGIRTVNDIVDVACGIVGKP